MNAVERVKEYSELQPEKYFPTGFRAGNTGSFGNTDVDTTVSDGDKEDYESPVGKVAQYLLKLTRKRISHSGNHNSSTSSNHSDTNINVNSTIPTPGPAIYQSGVQSTWPEIGSVEFRHVCLRYKSSSKNVLNHVNFKVPGGSSVGVVGRSGAGKSSLIAALFRLVEPTVVGVEVEIGSESGMGSGLGSGSGSVVDAEGEFTYSPLEYTNTSSSTSANININTNTDTVQLDPCENSVILIDGVNILNLPLHTLGRI